MNIGFVHVPKAAGGSIRNWLEINSKSYNFNYVGGHYFLHELTNLSTEPFDFTFSVVRNSFDRMISAYVFMDKKIKSRIKRCRKNNLIEEKKYWEKLLSDVERGIEYFIDSMSAKEDSNRFLCSQLDWIKGVECILQYENLSQDFINVQEKLNCFETLPRNRHIGNYNYKDFYSDNFKKIILKHFAEEIEYFKYLPRY